MSFETNARVSGREPFAVVELGLDRCVHRYGQAPCTAALGVTGSTYCYNTRATCQDTANYSPAEHIVRFCTPRAPMPRGLVAFPTIRSLDLTPSKIDIAGGIGQRASMQLTLRDHPYHDRALDPYFREREGGAPEDSALQALATGESLQASAGLALQALPAGARGATEIAGTFWGRMLARSPYYQTRRCMVRTGFVVDGEYDPANFTLRTYLLEQITGPDPSASVQLKAKDTLKLADDKRAQAPRPSGGRLSADIAIDATSLTLVPAGIGAEEYPTSGFARIGSEVIEFTRSGDVLTIERAQSGSDAAAHTSDDVVQLCLRYAAQRIPDIVYDLLANYADIDPSYLPLTEWDAEADLYLTRTYSTLITQPTPVTQLLTELTQSGLFAIWYDERQALVLLRALRAADEDAPTLNERQHLLADSVKVTEKPDLRVSQAWVYLGQIDPTEALDQERNFRQLVLHADLESEGLNKFRTPSIKRVYSRWLSSRSNADEVALRYTQLFGEVPRQLTFSLDAKDATWWLGDVIRLSTRQVQDFYGNQQTLAAQIIEADEAVSGHRFDYVAQVYNFAAPIVTDLVITISVDDNDVNLLDLYTGLYGAPSASTKVTFVVEAGVIIGQDVALQAMTTGLWPLGSTIILENNGRIQGRGGDGASFTEPGEAPTSASDGGDAFRAESFIRVDNAGDLWGGGGGGGLGGGVNSGAPGGDIFVNGGGGGAGTLPGQGGTSAAREIFGGFSETGTADDGTSTAGGAGDNGGDLDAGDGGGPGLAGGDGEGDYGSSGGAPGFYVRGNSFVTWGLTGDRRGQVS